MLKIKFYVQKKYDNIQIGVESVHCSFTQEREQGFEF